MSHFLMTAGAAIAVIAVAAPLVAIFLVSVASKREESAHTLAGQAPGPVTRAARRLLAYRAQTGQLSPWAQQDLRVRPRSPRPASRGRRSPAGPVPRPVTEPVPIGLVPDAGPHHREPAGTRAA